MSLFIGPPLDHPSNCGPIITSPFMIDPKTSSKKTPPPVAMSFASERTDNLNEFLRVS